MYAVFRGELDNIPRQVITFKQLRADVAALAYSLRKRGLKKVNEQIRILW